MTITIEPFAKLDAVCAGCGRSASVARICLPVTRDRHVVCERCLADLHRLTAPVGVDGDVPAGDTMTRVGDAAARLAAILGGPVSVMEEALVALEADGLVAFPSRQPTLEAIMTPAPATSGQAEAMAQAAVAEINRLTGRAFRATPEVVKQAKAIIKTKATAELVLAVIRFKHGEWRGKPDMLTYIQPSTLLRLSNFQKYRAAMEAGPVKTGNHKPVFRQLGED